MASCRNFVEEKLGTKYTEGRKTEFAKSYRESGPATPVFFILSPGVDPLKDVESLGRADMKSSAWFECQRSEKHEPVKLNNVLF